MPPAFFFLALLLLFVASSHQRDVGVTYTRFLLMERILARPSAALSTPTGMRSLDIRRALYLIWVNSG